VSFNWKEKGNIVFLMLVVVLGSFAVGKKLIINKLGIYLEKLPIDLQQPLDDLVLGTDSKYAVISRRKIENKDVEEELGTKEYIMWEVEDLSEPVNSPTRYCSLFITYYTGINDRIPHVPEECYFGAGNTVRRYIKGKTQASLHGGDAEELGFRMIEFVSTAQSVWYGAQKFYVCYMLRVNGDYASDRTEARNLMAKNLFGKYSYFAKIEWRFNGKQMHPNKEQVDVATDKLFDVLLPELEENHWPNVD